MRSAADVDALLFDVLGTVVDWRSAIERAGAVVSAETGVAVDWTVFGERWRQDAYIGPSLRVVAGEIPWMPLDAALTDGLGELLREFGIAGASPAALDGLATAWDRAEPWADVAEGLERLRRRHVIAPLSNATFASLVRLSRNGGMSWDCIVSTELFRTYKPDPRSYLGAAELLRLEPERAMLVSAHPPDLRGASACGLRTAYVPRAGESPPGEAAAGEFDLVASDFGELAALLGC